MKNQNPDHLCVSTLRMLSVDAIEAANSGHPGLPLGAAPMAYALWSRILRHNPTNPNWVERDRFILSAGHGSALLYALLHLSGYDLSLEEVKNFRQMGSLTPGHPEYGHTLGVEATTGPLGQGFAMGVGMAMAERRQAETLNRQEFLPIVDHFTYAIVSDGDLMEGIASEAASLAGHLCLGKIIYLYDDNHISIEGDTNITFSEDVGARFEAYQWHVVRVDDGEDLDAITEAIKQGQAEEERPTLIMVRTSIGHGSPKANTPAVHGSPLKGKDMEATRSFYDWPQERFHIPEAAADQFKKTILDRGQALEAEWQARLEAFQTRFPEDTNRFLSECRGELPAGWDTHLKALDFGDKPIATRSASGKALNAVAKGLPALLGGSADLAPSNKTWIDDDTNRNIHFGVREHAMGAIVNGMALHGGFIPFCGTFLVFADYLRGAIRLSALMDTHVIYVLTHDSLAVGEDGPTHQPVEHLASLRAIPNLTVFRPADAKETAAAWGLSISRGKPAALALSRQNLPILPGATEEGVARGGYVVSDCDGEPQLLLLATGGEVSLAVAAQAVLAGEGIAARVISMPAWELFEAQPQAYQDEILPPGLTARLAIEAGSSLGWHRWVGSLGDVIGVDRFGASAPGGQLLEAYGFSVENVVSRAKALL
ncbi:MAG: transketolase [Magnetococcales bacterium]|nr:transketolase [Magnetococcales bacterium]